MSEQLTEMHYWQVLNDLRKPGGRLICAGDGYRLMPSRQHVPPRVTTVLLGRCFVTGAPGEPAGVYVLTATGLEAWRRPAEPVTGRCDKCAGTHRLRPVPAGLSGVLLCDGCAARAGSAAVRPPWSCDECGEVVDSLTVAGAGRLLCDGCIARRAATEVA